MVSLYTLKMMMSIRKLTNCIRTPPPRSQTSSFKKLTSINQLLPSSLGYQPLSRFQKLRSTGLVFPKSTPDKIVFISNMQGNGFRNQTSFQLPSHIPVQNMKEQIDKVCYQKWREYKEFLESNAFAQSEKAIKILLTVGLTIICFLFLITLGNLKIVALIDALLVLSGLIVLACLGTGLIIFSKENPTYDYDTMIISSLKNKLAELNQIQKGRTQNEASFRWSCNKDCTWVAIQIFSLNQQFH